MQKTWGSVEELANAIEERALCGQNVTLSPGTAIWLARSLMAALASRQNVQRVHPSPFEIDLYNTGSCVMQINANGDIVEVKAWARNSLVAKAAFKALAAYESNYSLEQRRRSHVEEERIVVAK